MNYHRERFRKLMFRALALRQSERRSVAFENCWFRISWGESGSAISASCTIPGGSTFPCPVALFVTFKNEVGSMKLDLHRLAIKIFQFYIYNMGIQYITFFEFQV